MIVSIKFFRLVSINFVVILVAIFLWCFYFSNNPKIQPGAYVFRDTRDIVENWTIASDFANKAERQGFNTKCCPLEKGSYMVLVLVDSCKYRKGSENDESI